MAEIVGCIAMSHGPQLLAPAQRWDELPNRTKGPFSPKPGIEAELTPAAKLANAQRCDAAIGQLRAKLQEWSPDTVIVFGDDQEENILFDNMPPFTIFTGTEAEATLHFLYFGEKADDQMTRYRVNSALSWDILHGCMNAGFDPAWSKELRYQYGLGHAFGRALKFLMPDNQARAIVPIMVNTYYPPAPSAKRCLDFGRAVADVVKSSQSAGRVVLVGSGGLSHTKIDEALDRSFLRAIETNDIRSLTDMSAEALVAGTSEIRNWIAIAGAADRAARVVDYVPCYRTAQGVGCAMGFAIWQ